MPRNAKSYVMTVIEAAIFPEILFSCDRMRRFYGSYVLTDVTKRMW